MKKRPLSTVTSSNSQSRKTVSTAGISANSREITDIAKMGVNPNMAELMGAFANMKFKNESAPRGNNNVNSTSPARDEEKPPKRQKRSPSLGGS